MERGINEAKEQFPVGVKANIQAFLQEDEVNLDSSSSLQELKTRLFPGLIKPDLKSLLCKYRGAVEFPYTSAFDSRQVIDLLNERKRYVGWLEAMRRK